MADKNYNKFEVGDLVVLSAYGLSLKCQPKWLTNFPETIGFVVKKNTASTYPFKVKWFTNNEDVTYGSAKFRNAPLAHSSRELKSVRYK